MKNWLLTLICICIVGNLEASPTLANNLSATNTVVNRIYVNALATGDNDGSDWPNAFSNLNDALAYCASNEVEQIWIAEGIYKPSDCWNCSGSSDPRDYTFFIPIDDITLYGGFPNTGTPDWDDWDHVAFPTVLSGNIGNPNSQTDNCHHVVSGDYEVHLNGLIIQDGYTEGSGAGIYAYDARITNCTVQHNTALEGGGGLYSTNGAPRLLDSKFSYNNAATGGAVKNGANVGIDFHNCIFAHNEATNDGGAISTDLNNTNITGSNSLFHNNTAGNSGGAISGNNPYLSNCTFVHNNADDKGAAIYFSADSDVPKLYNCIFWSNNSSEDALPIEAIDADATIELKYGLTKKLNCAELGAAVLCQEGNIFDANNPFVSISNEDFKLKASAQAINTGSNNMILYAGYPDLSGNSRILGPAVDMGAYEFGNCQFNITTQTEIDNFATDNPGLTEIYCNMYIKSSSDDPITNLEGLEQITTIYGYLWIEKSNAINSLHGLHNLQTVNEYLKIEVNQGLSNFEGLESLTTVGGYCKLGYNYNLTSLDGLQNLSTVGGYCKIERDTSLTDMSALANLTSIGGHLSLRKNKVLTSLDGLQNLASINGYLELAQNPSLSDISALNNINPSTITELEILNNPALATCNEPFICAFLNLNNEDIILSENAPGCNSIATITSFCNYPDEDGDGFQSDEDCNDNNPAINPGATEILYNGVDDDCNPATLDDDLDQDGFGYQEDCDDSNAAIHPGATEIPYNGIDDDCDGITLDDDLDQDGFMNTEDCDDNNAFTNPAAAEIPYNGIDDDCDPATLDDDLDQDGFTNTEDCDDNNALANPAAAEIPYNGIDDDCNATTLDDDLDEDGFGYLEDCDDSNAAVHPDATEIPYNGVDDDCDGATLDDDLDQDGFTNVEDCDDNNALANPAAAEIPYNGIDDDCDPATLDDDLDQDGFGYQEDCDDNNALANPNAEEIPNNGTDEDCDGEDMMVGIASVNSNPAHIFPNPTSGLLNILFPNNSEATYQLHNLSGQLMMENNFTRETTVDISHLPQGVYTLLTKTESGIWIERIVKI